MSDEESMAANASDIDWDLGLESPLFGEDEETGNYDDPGAATRVVDSNRFFIGNVAVSIKMGQLEKEEVDVIVNSTSQDLNLKRGRASRALSEAAGPIMQIECSTNCTHGVDVGELAVTTGGRLKCNMVYHGYLFKWKTPGCEEIHKDFVTICLEELQKSKLKTIAFPALGTGSLHFPLDVVARNMLRSIKDYISSQNITTLQEVRIVIYPRDVSTYEAFKNEVKRTQNIKEEGDAGTKVVSTVMSGRIVITLIEGKVTEQKADVLVSCVTKELNLDKGQLSKSFLEDGGKSIQVECRRKYPRGVKHGELAVTTGGNLQCKAIFHGAIPKFNQMGDGGLSSEQILMTTMKACLEKADSQGFTSLVFPAFGTGRLNFPKTVTSRVMLQAINDFASTYPSTPLTDIRIVVYPCPGCHSIFRAFEKESKGSRTASASSTTSLPPRGSKEFCLAKYREELHPPPNWTTFHSRKTIKDWKISSENLCELVSVSQSVKKKIVELVARTWEPAKVGRGKDAVGLGHTSLKVTNVERIENIDLFEKYGTFRSNLFLKASRQGIFPKMENIKGSKGTIRTVDELDPVLAKDLYEEINESYFFHGTKKDKIHAILGQGLDFRKAGKAMFGQAIYFAENSTKADQYSDPKGQRSDDEKKMFLVRVCMGEMFICGSPCPFKRAPCSAKHCDQDECSHCDMEHYDSVVGDGKWIFREFVVYERHQSYPEYLITYVRE